MLTHFSTAHFSAEVHYLTRFLLYNFSWSCQEYFNAKSANFTDDKALYKQKKTSEFLVRLAL